MFASSISKCRIITVITGSAKHPFLAFLGTELQKSAAHDIGLKAITKAPLAAAVQSMFDVRAQHHR